jgi:hypothetical protein
MRFAGCPDGAGKMEGFEVFDGSGIAAKSESPPVGVAPPQRVEFTSR